MEQSTAKGAGFLKVTGILMIIGGALGIIFSIIALLGIAALATLADAHYELGMLYAAGGVALVGSIAQLVAGIIGVANSKKPEKAMTCVVFGVIVAVFNVAGVILNVAGGGSFNFVSLITGLILPVLYIVGAYMNKKAQ